MTPDPSSRALRAVQAFLGSGYFESHGTALDVEQTYLRGEHPHVEVVVLFRLSAAPATMYGWAHPVMDPEEPDGIAQYLQMHLAESVLTRAGSDAYEPDQDGVTWLPNFQDDVL